jgi:hypothetical protein
VAQADRHKRPAWQNNSRAARRAAMADADGADAGKEYPEFPGEKLSKSCVFFFCLRAHARFLRRTT